LGQAIPAGLQSAGWRRGHSPVEAWTALIKAGLTEAEAWDAVAYLWLAETDPARLQAAASLYNKNSAASHRELGDGRGPGADALAAQNLGQHDSGMHNAGKPAAFAGPRSMLGGTSEIYYAKLRRGGMGTGMPNFGTILTPEETWLLVDYLWTFVFQPEAQPVRQ
jgi:mono/diheme cytochrome c family protein